MSVKKRRREVQASLADAQLALDLVWIRESNDPFLTSLKNKLGDLLKRIAAEVATATHSEQFTSLAEQIQVCAAKRVYWLDAGQIQTEAEGRLRELEMWGVPQVYFDEHLKPLREAVRTALAQAEAAADKVDLRKAAIRRAQDALEALLLEYDYWDWYTDGYRKRILPWRYAVLGVLFLSGLVLALFFAFRWRMGVPAVACAGLAGTCVSILLKEEPLVLYRDMIKSWIWAAGRVMTGMVATVVGTGLLASGFISVGFSDDGTKGLVPLHAVVRSCLDFQVTTGDGASQRPDAGAADALPAAVRTVVDAGDKAAAFRPTPTAPERPCEKNHPCGNGAMLLVLGLAMLFGFSERAFVKVLGQFEQQLGGGSEPGPPATPLGTLPDGATSAAGSTSGAATQPPSRTGGVTAMPMQATGSAALQPLAPSPPPQPVHRTSTSPGLPAPSGGPPPAKPPKPPSGS
jgi:hypothetical protein